MGMSPYLFYSPKLDYCRHPQTWKKRARSGHVPVQLEEAAAAIPHNSLGQNAGKRKIAEGSELWWSKERKNVVSRTFSRGTSAVAMEQPRRTS
jgi:hypothetical protein